MRRLANSILIGLIALRVLPGQLHRRMAESIVITLFSLSFLERCSSQSAKTVETERTVNCAAVKESAQSQPVVSETQTTKTEEKTQTDGRSTGVLSGAVHVVGEVLALPFRAVAGLINLAF